LKTRKGFENIGGLGGQFLIMPKMLKIHWKLREYHNTAI